MKNNAATKAAAPDINSLIEDARALLSATGHVAEDKVVQARQRLADALERGAETLEGWQDRAVAGAKAADKGIREHPYQAIGVAFGVGALVAYLVARR